MLKNKKLELFTEDDFRTTQIESLVNLVAYKLEKDFSKGGNSIDACSTIYELIEEDVALCEFIDVSKNDLQSLLRKGLNLLKEG